MTLLRSWLVISLFTCGLVLFALFFASISPVLAWTEPPAELTHVSLDWRSERITIALNTDLLETDELTITWIKASTVSLPWPLSAWIYHIHDGESSETTWTCISIPDAGLNISDTEPWEIEIFLNWTLLNSYQREVSVTQQVDNSSNVLYWTDWSVSIQEWVPCEIHSSESTNQQPTEQTESTQPLSQWSFTISEIHPKNDIFGEYIEVQCSECLWVYTLQWFSTGTKEIDIEFDEIFSWRLVLVGEWSPLTSYISTMVIWSVSLTDWWETLSIVGQYWQVMDTATYDGSAGALQSRYPDNRSGSTKEATPWIEYEFWEQLVQVDTTTSNSKSNQTETQTQAECIGWNKSSWTDNPRQVSSINPRQVKYTSLTAQLEEEWHTLRSNGKIRRADSKPTPQLALTPPQSIDTCLKPDKDSVSVLPIVQLPSTTQPVATQLPTPGWWFVWSLTLVSVLPDPEWTDAGNEEVMIQSSTWWDRVEEITITVNDSPKTYQKNPASRSVDGDTLLIYWSLRLRNTDACVHISVWTVESNKLCYEKTKPWVEITVWTPQGVALSGDRIQAKALYWSMITRLREENEALRSTQHSLETSADIADELFFMRKNHIHKNYQWIYKESELERSYVLYRDVKESWETLLSQWVLPVETFEWYVALQTGSIPLESVSLSMLVDDYLL